LSFGIGGSSPFRSRPADTFGAGWYYAGASSKLGPLLAGPRGFGDGQGVELFYKAEITPAFHLTLDLQVIDPARRTVDTALLVGLRANLRF
ncbi:MAG: carbohydrate porin, partial [Planctomycetes bacterium]|nr:carbohydrate porin [Planctomycetota bacterium]